ncbi:MAG: substrate-binding domain-containing protein [Bacteroidales bacterium]|nr:substrate-binding domain-containing protein [Bacteroidales bacterium]
MPQKTTIKEIAKKAGVSIGTVDRVIHNRGRVSDETRQKILEILQKTDYRANLHASALSIRHRCKILVVLPSSQPGGYWWSVWSGIRKALKEHNDLKLDVHFLMYSQFDAYSCREIFAGIPAQKPDAVIIGTIFVTETRLLCQRLSQENIPYFFVDSVIRDTHPVAAFSVDQHACGMLAARLLHTMTFGEGKYLLMESSRAGNQWSLNSLARQEGFMDYFRSCGLEEFVEVATFSHNDPQANDAVISQSLSSGRHLLGAVVMNSRGGVVAEMFQKFSARHIALVAFDATDQNLQHLREGGIDALLCQRPVMQGYQVTIAAIRYIVYREKPERTVHHLPIDILLKENMDSYKEIIIA